ncbi:MAG: histidine phosphatase family protein [Anaerolineae bacterium]
MPEKTFYLIRHAAPQMGTGIAYDVAPGPPLSTDGRREARQVADFLAGRGIQRVVHSPLDRTSETAGALAERLGLTPAVDADLAEHRRGEPVETVRARVRALWEREVASGPSVIALVSHGSPLKELLEWVSEGRVDLTRFKFSGGNVIPTGGVWQVRGEPGRPWEALFIFQPNIMAEVPAPAWAAGGRVV